MPIASLLTPPYHIDPKRHYTLEEWQLLEETTGEQFEYHKGRLIPVRAMAGGTGEHALIGANVVYSLGKITRELDTVSNGQGQLDCGVYSSDLRLMLETEQRYVYPDAAVICGRPVYDMKIPTAARNPLLVVEVLSNRSASFDSGDKFDYYAALNSLRDYILISQNSPRIEVRSRSEPTGTWTMTITEGLDQDAHLPSLGQAFTLKDVYRLVEWR